MREIKFRGFRRKHQEWVEGFLVAREEPYLHDIIQPIGDASSVTAAVERDSVGQFTGLKDKNGTDIYEGDILQPKNKEYVFYEVSFENGEFVRSRKLLRTIKGEAFEESLKLPIYPKSYMVAGNIYEHPELLKERVEE